MQQIVHKICSYDPPSPETSQYPNFSFVSVGDDDLNVEFVYTGESAYEEGEGWKPDNTSPVPLDESMQKPLDSFVLTLSHFGREYGGAKYGSVDLLGHIGGRPVDSRPTYHNVGKALDITWVHWEDGAESLPSFAGKQAEHPMTHRRLIGVEAALRKWFGYVLNRGISNHHNHYHVDNGCPRALRLSHNARKRTHTSCAFFIQDCINAFTEVQVSYDGIWGAQSATGFKILLSDLGLECLRPVDHLNEYVLLLDYIMMHAFADRPAGWYRWGDNALGVA